MELSMNVYALRDVKAEAYLLPFFLPSHGLATRMVDDALRDGNNAIANHPNDFILYQLGSWDPVKGLYTQLETPALICYVSDFIPKAASAA